MAFGENRRELPGVIFFLDGDWAQAVIWPVDVWGRMVDMEEDKKGENDMRRYKGGNHLESVICNCCGKKLVVKDGIVREGVLTINHVWDFFSEKDGEVHHMDLCEDCYDEMVSGFRIPVDIEEQTELL